MLCMRDDWRSDCGYHRHNPDAGYDFQQGEASLARFSIFHGLSTYKSDEAFAETIRPVMSHVTVVGAKR